MATTRAERRRRARDIKRASPPPTDSTGAPCGGTSAAWRGAVGVLHVATGHVAIPFASELPHLKP